ncbi:prolyl 4-hydroxylase subunit alpha-2-like [Drosophila novamexicana]|uniref:prolyl 4-hydroxylase subunit alpha-2-like n=1 Tax=Drosophila novamexicana TaxID=47314 RepID=UPI0011E59D52|nr:prolyl 4-hydroxylase subunit alpha-2-like [Drosophila novamexicana]
MNLIRIIIFLASIGLSLFEANAIENLIREKSYAASTEVLKRLLDVEEMLEKNLASYVEELKWKLDLTQQALTKFRAEAFRMNLYFKTYLSNPLKSFALIRHQQQDWQKWALFMSETIGKEHMAYAHEMRSELPTAVDLQQASHSIELLITYYELNPNEFANGKLLGYSQPEAALSAMDCYALGMFNYFQKEYTKAEIWLNASLLKYDPSQEATYSIFINEKLIHKWLGILSIKRKEKSLGMWHINQAKTEDYDGILEEHIRMATLKEHCASSLQRPSHLHCRYNNWTTPFLRIAPLKMEELSMDPFVVLYHNVIYDSEIEWFLTQSFDYTPALLEYGGFSADRSGKNVFIELDKGELVKTIERRVTDMSGLSMEGSDDLSLINYGIGGHYIPHHDSFSEEENKTEDRIATALFYLSDVELGGATTFPLLNLTITPKKGTAILWHNLKDSGTPHPKTVHAACPVIVGSKYVMTKWIYNMDQIFRRPCQANSSNS